MQYSRPARCAIAIEDPPEQARDTRQVRGGACRDNVLEAIPLPAQIGQ